MKLLRGLLLKPTLNLLSWILRRNGNSVIIGGPLGWTWEPTIDATHHGALEGPVDAHRHSDLANIGTDDHHDRLHPTEHQDGGAQEISVAGLSGELADRQKSKTGDSTLGWTADKLLKGAGAGANPTEIDVPIANAVAGDELILSADTERSTVNTTYTKLKEIKLARAGTYRIKFDAKGDGHKARIYKNGSAVGTERTLTAGYQTFSEDISGWEAEDLCQLYAKVV